MKKIILIVMLSLFSFADKNITLQLSWKHQFQFAGYYMAKELGYYKDLGLNVNIKEYNAEESLCDVIENGLADFVIGRSSLLIDKVQGHDVVALGAIFQYSPMILLVKKDSGINKISDLKGKKVMITDDAKITPSIIAMLNSQDVQLSDIKVQQHSFDLNDLISGKTDAMASYISNEPIRLHDKGIDYKIFHPKDYGFDFYSDILFTSSDFIKNNPKVAKDFYKASIKGWKYAFNHIGKTAEIIYKKYNTQNISLVHLVSEAEALKKLIHHENTTEIGCLDKTKLQKIIDVYKVMGLINKDVNLDKFIYKYNNHKVWNFKFSHNDIYSSILLLIFLIIIIIFILFYLTIQRKWLLTKEALEEEVFLKTKELKKLTITDPLTKAKNRKAYETKIKELISLYEKDGSVFSIALFDIDDFKNINDNFGHNLGDKVLCDLVSLVLNNIRENDHLYRVGGEEFIILLENTALDKAIIVSEKIKDVIKQTIVVSEKEKVTISLGVTQISKSDNQDTIYTRVDLFMYKSKKTGKDKITYSNDD